MLQTFDHLTQTLGHRFALMFLAPGSMFSLESLGIAMLLGAASLAWPRLRTGRRVRLKALVRVLFPDRLIKSPSSRADFILLLVSAYGLALVVGVAVVSARGLSGATVHALTSSFGVRPRSTLNPALVRTVATLVLFLAYEFAYWLDHYLSHKVPVLWEFHKVHHTAEVLTPLTNFRTHPVDTLKFANIVAVIVGLAAGGLTYAFGGAVSPFALSGANVLTVAFYLLMIHLQHSHIWISFSGPAGRIFLSPAHHQIHHSAAPVHFNRNFGSCLSLFDWLFGTLCLPSRRRERLTFGAPVRAGAPSPHSVAGVLVAPFVEAVRPLTAGFARTAARSRPDSLA